MSFTKRRIEATITLGQGQFGANLGDTITLSGYRIRAEMNQWFGDSCSDCNAVIYGLPISTINQLTQMGQAVSGLRLGNTLTIAAGDENEVLRTYFTGTIWSATAQMQAAPDIALVITAQIGLGAAMKPVGASSYAGSVPVAQIMSDLAKEAGLTFENNGVTGVLRNPYLPYTTLEKIKTCARAAGCYWFIRNGNLSIWPANGNRATAPIPIISPTNGLLGYPAYTQGGVVLRTLLNPDFEIGKQFEVQGSIMTPANRIWTASSVKHSIESQMPNGAWFTDITGAMPAGGLYGGQ